MRHVVYASASCVGAPRALCCWRWRWQLTYFCGARLPTQGLNVQVCSLCTASTVLAHDCLISCEPVHVHHKHHHKHCVVGAGAGACAGDGECLISCRAGHVQSKGPCKLGMVGWTRFSSCFGFWRGNQCFWRENLLYQFQRKNYDLSMSGLWSSVHFRGRISYTY